MRSLAKVFLLSFISSTTVLAATTGTPTTGCLPMDAKVQLYLNPLIDNHQYSLRAETQDLAGTSWRYDYSGDKQQLLQLMKTQASRILWDMRPEKGHPDSTVFTQNLKNNQIQIEIKNEQGELVQKADFCREYWSEEKSHRQMVDEADLQGVFYRPKFQDKSPVLIRFGGLEGGISSHEGGLLANHGIASLTVGYHQGPYNNQRLAQDLEEIPMELVGRAIDWIKKQPELNSSEIYIYGLSRGSELALMGAVHYPEIKGVIAASPSSVIWPGFLKNSTPSQKSAWTWQAQALDFLAPDWQNDLTQNHPWIYLGGFRRGLEAAPDNSPSWLPIEKIQGKILLFSGTDDQFWPASIMAEQLVARAKKNNPDKDIQHIAYEGAGHLFGLPNIPQPLRNNSFWYGGERGINAIASEDSWLRTIQFIKNAASASPARSTK